MKKANSKSFEFDVRSIKSIIYTTIYMIAVFYTTNIDVINWIIQKYMDEDLFAVFVLAASYAAKKFITDYSK